MGRKTVEVTIGEDGGRDIGKTFIITEWPSSVAERWANRAILAVANAGAVADQAVASQAIGAGWSGIAYFGFRSLLAINDAIALELTEELMDCVKFKPSQSVTRLLNPNEAFDDIEEVTTRWKLKAEVFILHSGFSRAELLSKWTSAKKLAEQSNIPMSQEPSPPSFPPESETSPSPNSIPPSA